MAGFLADYWWTIFPVGGFFGLFMRFLGILVDLISLIYGIKQS